jgi:hypothetical protein
VKNFCISTKIWAGSKPNGTNKRYLLSPGLLSSCSKVAFAVAAAAPSIVIVVVIAVVVLVLKKRVEVTEEEWKEGELMGRKTLIYLERGRRCRHG